METDLDIRFVAIFLTSAILASIDETKNIRNMDNESMY